MKLLIKLFYLLSLLNSFVFADPLIVNVLREEDVKKFQKSSTSDYGFLGNGEFFYSKSLEKNFFLIYKVKFIDDFYYFGRSLDAGMYRFYSDTYIANGLYEIGNFYFRQSFSTFDSYYFFGSEPSGKTYSYTLLSRVMLSGDPLSCSFTDNFGLKSKKCFPSCPTGQSWDSKNEICYVDCSDINLNKFGYSNGTAQGGCVDCSNAFTDQDIARCVCSGFGSSLSENGVYISSEDSSFVSYSCADESSITFKRRSNEKIDKEKEKEKEKDKDKENPAPDKDKEKPNPDKDKNKDNNKSNNGSAGNGSSGGGNLGVETKPNPNYKGDEKEDGKTEGKGDGKQDGKTEGKEDGKEEGKGEDNGVAGKLDYGDLEKDTNNFKGDYSKAIEDSFSFVNDVKTSLSDTISKIKDGNLMSLKKSNIPSSCPLEYKVNLIYFEKELIFDICKAISPASQTLYYFFYFVFFVLLLFAVIKLFILTFMGW